VIARLIPMALVSALGLGIAGCPDLSTLLAQWEPPEPELRLTPARGPVLGGTQITIIAKNAPSFGTGTDVLFGGSLAQNVEVIDEQTLQVTAPPHVAGHVDVSVRAASGIAATQPDAFEYVAVADADAEIIAQIEKMFPGPPKLVSAVATSNTGLRVTFSEPVRDGATDMSNYSIIIPGGGFLLLDRAKTPVQTNNQIVVDLTTLSQADAEYQLTVTGVCDLAGNPIAPPDMLVDPAVTMFTGLAPALLDEHIDTDGDGFADWFEMLGWQMTIEFEDGTRVQGYVTSDPYNPDTDGDGMTDGEENAHSMDPRTDDTDADRVLDMEEWYEYRSNPCDQDSDDDGFADETEKYFGTSLILADTDGDQWDDREELLYRNRNPRLSDLPLPQIKVGEVALYVKETYSYTDEQGTEHSTTHDSSSALSQSTSQARSTSDTRASELTDAYSQKLTTEFELGSGSPVSAGFKIGAEVGFEHTRQRSYSSTVSQASEESASHSYQQGVSESLAFSERRSVTREIDDADVTVDVTISNLGDVAFSLSNLELSALIRDPLQRRDMPLGTLLSERALSSGEDPVYNLGALDIDRGPFIFKDLQAFPNIVQELQRSPRNVVIRISNYDITDESGRNFAFSSQDVNDRTAGLVIDYGNGNVESYRVATTGKFDFQGIALGITMRHALEAIIGLARVPGEDQPLAPTADLDEPAICDTYGVTLDNVGVERLSRVRGVQTSLDTSDPKKRFWVIITPQIIPDDTDFDEILLQAGQNYALAYVQDIDEDGLYASTEFVYGSSDENPDTDGDGLGDFDEARTGWVVELPGHEYQVFSSPRLADSDGDGLDDLREMEIASDPRKQDTDEDGVEDTAELEGYQVNLFTFWSGQSLDPTDITPYTTLSIVTVDGVVLTTAEGDDEQVIAVGTTVDPGRVIIRPGPDHILDTEPGPNDEVRADSVVVAGEDGVVATAAAGDDIQIHALGASVDPDTFVIEAGPNGDIDSVPSADDLIRIGHALFCASDPLRRDTDADSLFDGREQYLGSRPDCPHDADAVIDTDADGVTDAEETGGWQVSHGGSTYTYDSDPLEPDTDLDGLPDLLERFLGLNPRARDTDADGLEDYEEYDPDDPLDYFTPGTYALFYERCAEAPTCEYTPPSSPGVTNPWHPDTDGDGLSDGDEVKGKPDWLVYGQQVTSNPLVSDGDGDGLSDGEEYTEKTNPNNADTDGDGASDYHEVDQRDNPPSDYYSGSHDRDPLVPDQIIRVFFKRLEVPNDCGGSGAASWGDFLVECAVEFPDGSEGVFVTVNDPASLGLPADYCQGGVPFPCWNGFTKCPGWQKNVEFSEGSDHHINIPNAYGRRSFCKPVADTVTLRFFFAEVDHDASGCEYDHGPHVEYDALNGLVSPSNDNVWQNSDSCRYRLYYDVGIVE
jgi:hypothetical protein